MAGKDFRDDHRPTPRAGGGTEAAAAAARPAPRPRGRQAHLIEVATRLFMERGFDATSIDAIAEAAGMSKPTVYARYRDKRGLFEAVLRERIAQWIAPSPPQPRRRRIARGRRMWRRPSTI